MRNRVQFSDKIRKEGGINNDFSRPSLCKILFYPHAGDKTVRRDKLYRDEINGISVEITSFISPSAFFLFVQNQEFSTDKNKVPMIIYFRQN